MRVFLPSARAQRARGRARAWLLRGWQWPAATLVSPARRRRSGRVAFVLVVEKDCIFHRLAQDGLPQKSRCAMVTGKGMPDLAARAMTWRLATRFKCPVLALTDCNPAGMNVALAFKLACKSSTLPSADEEQFSETCVAKITASHAAPLPSATCGAVRSNSFRCCRGSADGLAWALPFRPGRR